MADLNLNNDYYGNISNNYSATLSNEIAILRRKLYLPLLPLEKMNDLVLGAYRYLGRTYWTKEDVYEAKEGSFMIPMLCPLLDNNDETTEIIHAAPSTDNMINEGSLETSDYSTTNYIPLVIPRFIIMQFSNLIPAGTQFNVSFMGGSSANYSIKINSIAKTVEIPDGEWDDRLYDTNDMSFDAIVELVNSNLEKIDKEEDRRKKEENRYAQAITETVRVTSRK